MDGDGAKFVSRPLVLGRGARGLGGRQAQEGGAPLQRRHRGHLRRPLPSLLLPVGGQPLHRREDRGGLLHEGQPEGQALAPAGGRLRLRLVGREVHQGGRQDARPGVRRRRPASAGRARVLQLRAEGRRQQARRSGDDQLRRRRGRRRARDLQLRPDAEGAAHHDLVLGRGGAGAALSRDPRRTSGSAPTSTTPPTRRARRSS